MIRSMPYLIMLSLCGTAGFSAPAEPLTLNSEVRVRYDAYDNRFLKKDQDHRQGLFRGILGADLRVHPDFRVYSEIGVARLESRQRSQPANFQNDASLQQLFLEASRNLNSARVVTTIGRQEFAEGPRQLISLSDGPNLHRTWNGARFHLDDQGCRLGAFDFRATRLETGSFDERIDNDERIRGLHASFMMNPEQGLDIHLDPYWIQSKHPRLRLGIQLGPDDRHTAGIRVWGKSGAMRFDWTLAHQTGEFMNRSVEAWGAFAVQSLELYQDGWRPTLMLRMDAASGGGSDGEGKLRAFHQLYASSNYLGEGQFLSLSNLLMITPGLNFAPASRVKILMEYGFARRMHDDDPVYAGGMRVYEGTESVKSHAIGSLLRLTANWTIMDDLSLVINYERLFAGDVLRRVHLPSGSYGQLGVTLRR